MTKDETRMVALSAIARKAGFTCIDPIFPTHGKDNLIGVDATLQGKRMTLRVHLKSSGLPVVSREKIIDWFFDTYAPSAIRGTIARLGSNEQPPTQTPT